MTDIAKSTSTSLDPQRPWLKDPEDLPAGMKWSSVLFNPLGRLPRLHFTRAWTVLFFARVLILVVPGFLAWIITTAGGNSDGIKGFAGIAIPLVLIVTVFMSYNIHIKRLTDAGKPAFLAILIFVPLILAGGVFGKLALDAGTKYEVAAAKRLYDAEHPEEARAARTAAAAKSAEEARANRSGGSDGGKDMPDSPQAGSSPQGGGGGRGGRRGGAPGVDETGEPLTKSVTMLNAGRPAGQYLLLLLDFPLMLWTLLWVARKPRKELASEFGEQRSYESV